MKFNTRFGKLASMLVSTLTSLAGEYNVDAYLLPEPSTRGTPSPMNGAAGSDNESEADDLLEDLPAIQRLPRGKNRTKMIESQMHEQAKLVNNLMTYGASEATIEIERRRLQRLEAALYSEFRREMVEKLRKQSQKATTSFKDRIGLAYKSSVVSKTDDYRDRKRSSPLFPPRRHSESTQRKTYLRQQSRTNSVDVGRRAPKLIKMPLSFDLGDDDESPPLSPELLGIVDDESPAIQQAARSNKPETSSSTVVPGSPRVHQTSPSINLYLDVKIYVDSGECTFQTVPPKGSLADADAFTPKVTSRTSRSMKNKLSNHMMASNRAKTGGGAAAAPVTTTKIALPGLNVKSFYASHSGPETTGGSALNPQLLRAGGMTEEVIGHMISSTKKGQFFICLSLESMPVETVVSPHILGTLVFL